MAKNSNLSSFEILGLYSLVHAMEEQRFGERNGALEFGGGGGQAAEGEEEELESQFRCLDLTSFQLRSEIEIPEDLVELDLNANSSPSWTRGSPSSPSCGSSHFGRISSTMTASNPSPAGMP